MTYQYIKITGIHVYFGSQLMDEDLIAANFSAISCAALKIGAYFPIEYINYGGGFGVPYEEHEEGKPDLPLIAKLVEADENTQKVAENKIRRNIELGRYLTAESGLYLSRITDIKASGGKAFVILDGGMNRFFRPKFTGQRHQIIHITEKEEQNADNQPEEFILVGNTCTPLDVFYDSVFLTKPLIGDIVAFQNAGAYGYSMSLLDFISFDRPEQVMY
jgi:diaminopimelate decarboxylase